MEENTKLCPFCGGAIPADAESCTFCGVDLKSNAALAADVNDVAETVAAITETNQSTATTLDAEALPVDFPQADAVQKGSEGSIPAYVPKPVEKKPFDLPEVPADVNVQVAGAKTTTNNASKAWLWVAIAVVGIIALCICCIAGLVVVGLAAN